MIETKQHYVERMMESWKRSGYIMDPQTLENQYDEQLNKHQPELPIPTIQKSDYLSESLRAKIEQKEKNAFIRKAPPNQSITDFFNTYLRTHAYVTTNAIAVTYATCPSRETMLDVKYLIRTALLNNTIEKFSRYTYKVNKNV